MVVLQAGRPHRLSDAAQGRLRPEGHAERTRGLAVPDAVGDRARRDHVEGTLGSSPLLGFLLETLTNGHDAGARQWLAEGGGADLARLAHAPFALGDEPALHDQERRVNTVAPLGEIRERGARLCPARLRYARHRTYRGGGRSRVVGQRLPLGAACLLFAGKTGTLALDPFD